MTRTAAEADTLVCEFVYVYSSCIAICFYFGAVPVIPCATVYMLRKHFAGALPAHPARM